MFYAVLPQVVSLGADCLVLKRTLPLAGHHTAKSAKGEKRVSARASAELRSWFSSPSFQSPRSLRVSGTHELIARPPRRASTPSRKTSQFRNLVPRGLRKTLLSRTSLALEVALEKVRRLKVYDCSR